MADTLRIDEFVEQLWDGELCSLSDLIQLEMRRRAQRMVRGEGIARDWHVPLATARITAILAE
jgi:hypothetical protein